MDDLSRMVMAASAGQSLPSGQASFTTPGTFSFTVPDDVYSISIFAVGGGQGGWANPATPTVQPTGGRGGGTAYSNDVPVTPGEILTVFVGAGGVGGTTSSSNGGASSVSRGGTVLVRAREGSSSPASAIGQVIGGQGNAGTSTVISGAYGSVLFGGGGAGAAGYGGQAGGGAGHINPASSGGAGAGGGGGRSNSAPVDNATTSVSLGRVGSGGGGVGLLGAGSNGTAGSTAGSPSGGRGGSGGGNGGSTTSSSTKGGNGGLYGGGGGGGGRNSDGTLIAGGDGARGAVRIIWPGSLRQFPSTRTADE